MTGDDEKSKKVFDFYQRASAAEKKQRRIYLKMASEPHFETRLSGSRL